MSEYKKSLEDEIDWKIIDQLHAATNNFSTMSLELKKLLIVLIGVAIPSIIKLTNNKLDISLFFTIYIITISFWFLDSYTYFYQEKLREKMDKHFDFIMKRNSENYVEKEFTLEEKRKQRTRIVRSIFNNSIYLHTCILIMNTLAVVLYLLKII